MFNLRCASPGARWLRGSLVLWLVAGCWIVSGNGQAQPGAAAPGAPVAGSAGGNDPAGATGQGRADPAGLSRAAAELEQVQAALARMQSRTDSAAPDPMAEEQRNLLTRLVGLLRDRMQRASAAPTLAAPAMRLPSGLAGDPPFPVADLDALRDQREGIASQRDSLTLSVQALDTELNDHADARRKVEEGLRLQQERVERARDSDERIRLRAGLELERLRERVATLELARVDAERAAARARLQTLNARIGELDGEIDRVRRQQVLDEAALTAVATAADSARLRWAAQRERVEGRIARMDSEGGGSPDARARKATALRGVVQALATLEQVEAGRAEAWRLRRLALQARSDRTRLATAQALLRRSIDQLALRERGVSERLNYLKLALRTQRLKVEALGQGADVQDEAGVLQAMGEEVLAHERLREETHRLHRLLQRSLDDLLADAEATAEPRSWTALAELLRTALLAVWRYELFSATETLQVDGRTVALDYGVTIGKSLGVLLLFALGYALAGRLSRLLVAMAVRQARISPQLGAVLHRWVMTTLLVAVLLVVLKLARIPLTAFAFLGGALAIGIGFGTQNVIKNLISGIIILFERKVRVGDVVTIDGVDGTVTAVDLRATTVHGFDGIDCIVPNSRLLENPVSNWSHGEPVVRRVIRVRLAWGQDAGQAADEMLVCARADSAVRTSPAPQVLYEDFGMDAQVLTLQYWIRLGGTRSGPVVDSDLRHAIANAFERTGLKHAAPRMDVRQQGPIPTPVPARTGGPGDAQDSRNAQ